MLCTVKGTKNMKQTKFRHIDVLKQKLATLKNKIATLR